LSEELTGWLAGVLGQPPGELGGYVRALTHGSQAAANYERLEFLGDRVLSLVMAEIIFMKFPGEKEGDLAKRHASLVQGKTLSALARTIGLGDHMRFSPGEKQGGGDRNENILADALESLLGALYLDGGIGVCRTVIETLWGESIHELAEPPMEPKTALQEWAQKRGLKLPVYEVTGREGPDHAPVFEITVTVEGHPPFSATGSARRAAEKEAALLLLHHLQEKSR